MLDPWLPLLQKLSLSRTEREVVKRYEGDPFGRSFLPVADILRSHRYVDESLELLTQGVDRHQNFSVARVVLARELFQKGLIEEAWNTLEESPVNLRDNVLAQKLRFKLSMLLKLESVTRNTYQHLKMNQMLDSETKTLGDFLEISGFDKARDKLFEHLKGRGLDPVIPDAVEITKDTEDAPEVADEHMKPSIDDSKKLFKTESFDSKSALEGFHVVPLDEVFKPNDSPVQSSRDGGVELDSTTLADIYAKQGHYGKALAVYRRLLRLSPNNDMLRRKVAEITRAEVEQRDVDLTVDPSLVDRMETLEIIDRQIRFYNGILAKLT